MPVCLCADAGRGNDGGALCSANQFAIFQIRPDDARIAGGQCAGGGLVDFAANGAKRGSAGVAGGIVGSQNLRRRLDALRRQPNFFRTNVDIRRFDGLLLLRLERSGHTFTGYVSPNGRAWTRVGTTTYALPPKLLAGLAVCSRRKKVTTVVGFDHVAMTGG